MKTTFACSALLAFLSTTVQAQSFAVGDLAVLRVGDGSAALTSAATPLFIDEYNLLGTLVQTIPIPTTAAGLTLSGSATSEGALTLSSDGTLLTFGGYAAAAGTAGIASTTATVANRAVGVLNAGGIFSRVATGSTTAFSANNVRGAVSDGQNFWMSGSSGASGGQWYSSSGGTPSQITNGNFRVANIFSGTLYYSTGSGTRGIYAFSGIPTSAAAASLLFGNGSSSSPYDFAFNPAGTIAYVADDDLPSAGGGIEKWTNNAGVWGLAYTLSVGGLGSTNGARQLTVDFSGLNPIIFATTSETVSNRLVRIEDTGASSTALTLATATANEIFRGVDFVPTPEPSVFALAALGSALAVSLRRRKS